MKLYINIYDDTNEFIVFGVYDNLEDARKETYKISKKFDENYIFTINRTLNREENG